MKPQLRIAVTHTVRARVAYEIALGLAALGLPGGTEITIALGIGNSRLGGLGGPELLENSEFDLAFVNPSAMTYAALNGLDPFGRKIDIRGLAVFPSWDRVGFAVKKSLAVRSLREIGERRIPLRLSVRSQGRFGTTEFAIRRILKLSGWTLEDLEPWGGKIDGVPSPVDPRRFEGLERRAYDAVFDEGLDHWANLALAQDMIFVPLENDVLTDMERLGFRRATISTDRYQNLAADVMTIDFSGWPLICRADFPAEDAYTIVMALDNRKASVPVEADKLDMNKICRDTEDGPLCIPLHPGAERYYREKGYLI